MTRCVSILQSNYIPWKGYFDIIDRSDIFVIYDEVQYTKNDWRNRNIIKSSNGNGWITIPVRQVKLDQTIEETQIAWQKWSTKHWKSIKQAYSKAPFFLEYQKWVEDLYLKASELQNLSSINCLFIREIAKELGIDTQIILSNSIITQAGKNQRLLGICKELKADQYLSGASASSYLDVALFKQNKINVKWMSYEGYTKYSQLSEPFEHSVSVLDLIFNTGKDAIHHIRNNLFDVE